MYRKMKWGLIALVLLVPVVGVPIVCRGIRQQQDAAKGSTCNGQMCSIALSMHSYHDTNGHFPPAYLAGSDGKPAHSWRVLLLPFIEQQDLYKAYRFDEPWDGPSNRQLAGRMPRHYACPSDPEGLAKGVTSYFVVVGPGTAFPGAKPTKLDDITRPRDQTVLLVEAVGQDICWMDPRDLTLADMRFAPDSPGGPTISSKHRLPWAAFADGTRRGVGKSEGAIDPLDLRAMMFIRPEDK